MNIELPPTIAAFFQAFNAHDTDTLALFSPERRLYLMKDANITAPTQSKDGLRKPMPPTNHMPTQPTSLIPGDKIVVTAQVSGTFPRSPAELRYHFTLKDDKIAALTCD